MHTISVLCEDQVADDDNDLTDQVDGLKGPMRIFHLGKFDWQINLIRN